MYYYIFFFSFFYYFYEFSLYQYVKMKILVNMEISILEFYGYIKIFNKISMNILTKILIRRKLIKIHENV